MILKGRVFKYGNNIDTDVIIPARYLTTSDPDKLAEHCMEDLDPEFTSRVEDGDIIVAGENFGSGSSREHAPLAIKASGISCVIAVSFARIFYRNAINIGLPILSCPEAVRETENNHTLKVELNTGSITNLDTEKIYRAEKFPPFMQDIIREGGLIERIKRRLTDE